MRIFRFFLVLCMPAFLLNPIPAFSQEKSVARKETSREIFIPRDASGKVCPWELFSIENLAIDNYFDFIELLENEMFLESLTAEEFDDVVEFIISMVRYSVPKDDSELKEKLEEEIEELLYLLHHDKSHEQQALYSTITLPSGFKVAIPLSGNPRIVLCGGFWSGVGHWVKKNKKYLIIAGIAAGVATVAILTGGVGASSAVAVGGALVSATSNDDHRKASSPVNKAGEVVFQDELFLDTHDFSPSSQIASSPSLITPALPLDASSSESIMETSRELAEATKVELVAAGLDALLNVTEEESIKELKEGVREKTSHMAHSALDTLAEITEYFYELNPSLGPEDLEAYLAFIDEKHVLIDELFLTGHASLDGLSAEERALVIKEHCSEMQIGILPVPGVGLVKVAGRAVAAAATEGALGGAIVGGALARPGVIVPVEESMTVYRAFNPETGEVSYVGITNNIDRRGYEHARQKGIQIEAIEGLGNLSKADARAVEQTLIELHKLEKDGGTLINKINSISQKKPEYAESLRRGAEILEEIEYEGLK